ncbi:MAG: ATPase [Actinomycetia bacterium]|nr:ATPase [Actinomycetes bacterium]
MAQTEPWESELLNLIGQAEDLVAEAKRVPLTGRAMIDADGLLALLDHMRRALPEDIRRARWIIEQRDRLLSEARAEAEQAVGDARAQVGRMTEESTIVREAEARAEQIIAQAQKTARDIRQGARAYADELLGKLESHLEQLAAEIKSNRAELRG